ncbi:transporter [Undibacterium terreum]|uniref:MetA-pathway of phenol degradation n=1 Tax=Undibacterium terreum TaxID=1224302 RepID=A0A916XK71_9BURK|nr:transporter [Undibacterium terreum]GGC80678.1 hypothetical protein GCM10011396_29810 [Undibacterium terreum]
MKSKSAILLILGLLIKSAFAAHPLSSDDSVVQGKDKQQLELNTDSVRFQGERVQVGDITYTYGVNDDLDAFLNLPMNLSRPSGIADVSAGGKWQFKEYLGHLLAFKAALFLPSGNQQRGIGQGRYSLDMGLIDSYTRSAWTVHGNLMLTASRYQHSEDRAENRKMVWRASTAVMYQANAKWTLTVDTGFTQADSKAVSSRPVYLLGGIIYSPNTNMDLDVGIRRERIAGNTEKRLGIGLTMRYQ